MNIHGSSRRRWSTRVAVVLGVVTAASITVETWGPQGHRLVALVAASRLTAVARQNVTWLLGDQSLADVAVWADRYLEGNNQTSFWHYVNIPLDAVSYERDRDCPRQPGVSRGGRGDEWRDCVVDRIFYNRGRLADTALDRADRAIALKFLVHLVGDLHQPFHAVGVERGGNGIAVSVFGADTCGPSTGSAYPCNLHAVWDSALIEHRALDDRQYLRTLDDQIAQKRWDRRAVGLPAEWAMQSHDLARRALPRDAAVDDAYYRMFIADVDERLALGGLRLATILNEALTASPPAEGRGASRR